MSVPPHDVRRLGGARAVVRLRARRLAHAVRGLGWCLRINRRTRSFEVRIPSTRSFAQTFRYPSPCNGDASSTRRMWTTRTASGAAAMPPRAVPRCLPPRIDTRPRSRTHASDALHTIRPTGGDRLGATQRVDLRRATGRPASSWSTFAYSNSVSIQEFADLGLPPTVVVVHRLGRAALQAGLARH